MVVRSLAVLFAGFSLKSKVSTASAGRKRSQPTASQPLFLHQSATTPCSKTSSTSSQVCFYSLSLPPRPPPWSRNDCKRLDRLDDTFAILPPSNKAPHSPPSTRVPGKILSKDADANELQDTALAQEAQDLLEAEIIDLRQGCQPRSYSLCIS